VCEFQHKRFVNNFNSAKTIYADIARVELPKILPPSYRGISIRYFYYVRTTLFGRPVVLGNGDQYKGLVNSAIQLVSGKLVFLLLVLTKMILLEYACCMLKIWICRLGDWHLANCITLL
jgi:hypothetical protein